MRNPNLTKCHARLSQILSDMGFTVYIESHFDPYYIDCYLRELHLGFEADGDIWHSKIKDRKRDTYLLEEYDLPILRFSEKLLLAKKNEFIIKHQVMLFIEEYRGLSNGAEKFD